jgi:hypothetical protein
VTASGAKERRPPLQPRTLVRDHLCYRSNERGQRQAPTSRAASATAVHTAEGGGDGGGTSCSSAASSSSSFSSTATASAAATPGGPTSSSAICAIMSCASTTATLCFRCCWASGACTSGAASFSTANAHGVASSIGGTLWTAKKLSQVRHCTRPPQLRPPRQQQSFSQKQRELRQSLEAYRPSQARLEPTRAPQVIPGPRPRPTPKVESQS